MRPRTGEVGTLGVSSHIDITRVIKQREKLSRLATNFNTSVLVLLERVLVGLLKG